MCHKCFNVLYSFQKLKVSEERVKELEAAALANLPMDSAKEISTLQSKMKQLENERDENVKEKLSLETDNKQLQLKLKNVEKKGQSQQTSNAKFEVSLYFKIQMLYVHIFMLLACCKNHLKFTLRSDSL